MNNKETESVASNTKDSCNCIYEGGWLYVFHQSFINLVITMIVIFGVSLQVSMKNQEK